MTTAVSMAAAKMVNIGIEDHISVCSVHTVIF